MTLAKAIMATLAYHDVFDYPLTSTEIHSYLISQKADLASVEKSLRKLVGDAKVGKIAGIYFLKGKANLVKLRRGRQKYSEQKLKRAYFFAKILKIIPTVKLVAVSGALAMANSQRLDDIDLVIITSTNTLWTTRFLSNLILWPFKRDPHGKKVADRACLNVFIDQSSLNITPQNLYLAHEISQMKPIWDRDHAYSRFIKANLWVTKFLPNWQSSLQFTVHSSQKSKPLTARPAESGKAGRSGVNRQPSVTETLLKRFQFSYMSKRISTEKIGEGQLFFHPVNTGQWVIKEYQRRIQRLKEAKNVRS